MTFLSVFAVVMLTVAAVLLDRAHRAQVTAQHLLSQAQLARSESAQMKADATASLDQANRALTHAQAIYHERMG